VIVVDRGIEVFLVKTVFLDAFVYRLPVFRRKGETSQNNTQMLHFVRKELRKQAELWRYCNGNCVLVYLNLHVCV
jgi:hypothetical protein